MTNRDYILKTNECDMLSGINLGIMDDAKCVIEAITGEYQYYEKERCRIHTCREKCEKCISAWLNQERK